VRHLAAATSFGTRTALTGSRMCSSSRLLAQILWPQSALLVTTPFPTPLVLFFRTNRSRWSKPTDSRVCVFGFCFGLVNLSPVANCLHFPPGSDSPCCRCFYFQAKRWSSQARKATCPVAHLAGHLSYLRWWMGTKSRCRAVANGFLSRLSPQKSPKVASSRWPLPDSPLEKGLSWRLNWK